ncbi:MAG: hypothetical protein ABIR25_02870 [Sphingomicrobium sp.]
MKLVRLLPFLLLSGCGNLGPLRPPAGQALPVKPAMAQTVPTADDLLTKPAFAAPERIDELMKRSMPRKADRFDLPPPDGGAVPLPEDDQPASDAVRVQTPQ